MYIMDKNSHVERSWIYKEPNLAQGLRDFILQNYFGTNDEALVIVWHNMSIIVLW